MLAGDLLWSWQKFSNDLEGQASDRTGAWEAKRVIGGAIFITFGVVIAIIGVSS